MLLSEPLTKKELMVNHEINKYISVRYNNVNRNQRLSFILKRRSQGSEKKILKQKEYVKVVRYPDPHGCFCLKILRDVASR